MAIGLVGILLGSGVVSGVPGFASGGAADTTNSADTTNAAATPESAATSYSAARPRASAPKDGASAGIVFAPAQTTAPPANLGSGEPESRGPNPRRHRGANLSGAIVGVSALVTIVGLGLLIVARRTRRTWP